ncbi:MFS domain-containing protein [Fusarium sp. LHS14.1]|nr:MFS domain-containing protein [Fusarium sp. LHS14.1]
MVSKEHDDSAGAVPVVVQTLQVNNLRKVGILVVMNTVALVQAFDATCICVTLPALAKELDASFSESLSMGSVFLLATAISQPIFAELAHVIGRRPAYIAALTIFISGTILCGAARNSLMLLAGRVVQGVGSGGPQALSGMILADLFPIRERSRWVAYQNVSWALGTIAGPLVGGAFVENVDSNWRWIFWCTLPFLGCSFIGCIFMLGYDSHQRNWRLIKDLDWIGILLFAISSVSILLPLTWGGSRFPWKSAQVLVPIGISIVSFVALGAYERVAKKPMFRQSLFRNRSTILQFINAMIHGIIMWMVLYYLAVFFLGVKGKSPLMTGVWALPATVTVAPVAAVVGIVAYKTGKYQGFMIGGWGLLVAILGAMTVLDQDTTTHTTLIIILLLGIAMGLLIPVMSIGVQATVEEGDVGHAISMIYALRTMGQCLGIAIGITVFSSQLRTELKSMNQDTDHANNAMKLIKVSIEQGGFGRKKMTEAVVMALKHLWATGSALAGLAFILGLFARCPKLPKNPEDHVEQATGFPATPIGRVCAVLITRDIRSRSQV